MYYKITFISRLTHHKVISHTSFYLIFTETLQVNYYYFPFTGEDTEIPSGQMTCLMSHNQMMAESGLKLMSFK